MSVNQIVDFCGFVCFHVNTWRKTSLKFHVELDVI